MYVLMLIPVWLWAGPGWRNPAGLTAGLTVIALAVAGLSGWRRARSAVEAHVQRAELEEARRAALEERTRIARELHDVVAHHMSLIAVQAETAPYRLKEVPERIQEEFTSLSGSAREALADMRRLLGVLRDDRPAERSPQPQLTDLRRLVASARRAGMSVELSLATIDTPVPPHVEICAYRIVQEAVSNAGRHAPGAAVTVQTDQTENTVRLRVTNGPSPSPEAPRNKKQPGHGMTGMRERVTLLGGTLAARPTADGGFVVSAVLPLGTPGEIPR
jgi:signal transduction histidine kinase